MAAAVASELLYWPYTRVVGMGQEASECLVCPVVKPCSPDVACWGNAGPWLLVTCLGEIKCVVLTFTLQVSMQGVEGGCAA